MVSVVIPLYFSDLSQYGTIKKCFESLKDLNIELIVIDDASPMPTEDFPTTFRNKKNLGYTATVNKGLEETTGDVLIIANQDLVFTEELIERFRDIDDGIYSPMTSDAGNSEENLFGSIWGMTRFVYKSIGALEPRLKHFFSDKDYYLKAKDKNIKIIKWEDLVVEHDGGSAYTGRKRVHLYDHDFRVFRKIWGADAY